MKKRKSIRYALITSLLSMSVCIAMLVGSTFAWFTDSVSSANNRINSGNLTIDFLVKDENGNYQSIKESQDSIFTYDKWEPGYTVVKHFKISNKGSLALKYLLYFDTEETRPDNSLADVIDVYYAYAAEEVVVDNRDLKKLTYKGSLSNLLWGENKTLVNGNLNSKVGNDAYVTIALKMKEDAGNDYQGLSIDNFSIKLDATQDMYESDSFDDQYDKEAMYPVYVNSEDDLKNALADANFEGDIILNDDITISESLSVSNKKININLNERSLKSNHSVSLIQAIGNADIGIYGGTLTVDNSEEGTAVIAQDNAKVIIEDCIINYPQGKGYGITTNGTLSKNVNITIRNSTISAEKNYACYFPAGNIVMENCNVTGAVIISGGNVHINDGIYIADGFNNQPKIWHASDTIKYMSPLMNSGGCGHMGDSILIMDRRNGGYGVANVIIENVTFNTELTLSDGSKKSAYAIKYVDYNNIENTERGNLVIRANTYNHKLDDGKDPLMFIGIDGSIIER